MVVLHGRSDIATAGMRRFLCQTVFLLVLVINSLNGEDPFDLNCQWAAQDKENAPEIFWINLDKSVDRRMAIEAHLNKVGFLHRRVKGLTLDDIVIPEDVLSNWDKLESKIETHNFPKRTSDTVQRHVMTGLVGRSNTNKLKEIGCTSSHLEAMRQAIYNNRSSSRYALIIEDDVQIPFNIDFEKLAQSAPSDFGILQLFNSNEESMESTWGRFLKRGDLWSERLPKTPASYWSTCAYLIDREVMRPRIDKVAYADRGWINLKLIAGIKQPCRPKFSACCKPVEGTQSFAFMDEPPCVWAPKGFQADSYLYSLGHTYVLGVPLITNSAAGNVSTFHQSHVETIHQSAFRRQRLYINEMIEGKAALPSFASLACKKAVTTDVTVVKAPPCRYTNMATATEAAAATSPAKPRIYWLQWNHRPQQGLVMQQYLSTVVGAPHQPVRVSINESNMIIPNDVEANWGLRSCLLHSKELKEMSSIATDSDQKKASALAAALVTDAKSKKKKEKEKLKVLGAGTGSSTSVGRGGGGGDVMYVLQERDGGTTGSAPIVYDGELLKLVAAKKEVRQHTISEFKTFTSDKHALLNPPRTPSPTALPTQSPTTHLELPPETLQLVSGLCGRGKGHNTLTDLAITVAHLHAMYRATSDSSVPTTTSTTTSTTSVITTSAVDESPYAVIIDDDIHLPFDIDFHALAQTAPSDFGILRLMQGIESSIENQYQRFKRNSSYLWVEDKTERHYDAAAASAYVIHKERVQSVLQHMVKPVSVLRDPKIGPQSALDFKVIAGLHSPCIPAECCTAGDDGKGGYKAVSPCIDSRKGFQAERFLFRMGLPTYVLTVPLVVNRRYLNISKDNNIVSATGGTGIGTSTITSLSAEVNVDEASYRDLLLAGRKQVQFINELLSEKVELPSFARIGCSDFLLPV